jgi:hypothetical protein
MVYIFTMYISAAPLVSQMHARSAPHAPSRGGGWVCVELLLQQATGDEGRRRPRCGAEGGRLSAVEGTGVRVLAPLPRVGNTRADGRAPQRGSIAAAA